MQNFVRFHLIEPEQIFRVLHFLFHYPKNSGEIVTTAPLASYALENYISVIFQNKCIECKIFYDSMQ